jgi:Ca-activated chloride channel family protein
MTVPDLPPAASGPSIAVTAAWERPLVPAAGGDATLLVRVVAPPTLAAGRHRRTPLDVAFVLDRSGSMAGEKLELVKRAVDVAVGFLRDEDRAALVVYDHTVAVAHALSPATARAKTALRLALHGVDAGGSTDLGGGWLAGCRELSGAPPPGSAAPNGAATAHRLCRAILLTDGQANVGITDPAELTVHAHELRKRGIGTATLGVGLGFDELLLAGMAEAGGGTFRFAAGPAELPAFFAHELRELLTIAAAGLTLELTLPAGAEAELVNAFPSERRGDRLSVDLGELPAGGELDLVLRLRVPAGRLGAAYPVHLGLAWSDPAADARRTLTVDPDPLVVAGDAAVAAATPDPLVAERAALQLATAERRAALALDRAGRHAESRAGMHRAVAMLQAAPFSPDVQEDLAFTARYAATAADSAYGETEYKRGAFHNARRARGQRDEADLDGR